MNKEITSVQNPYIKELYQLKEKSRDRKKSGLFLIEGAREIGLAIKGKYLIETLLYYPELFSEAQLNSLIPQQTTTIQISKDVYQKLAHRDTTEGVIAVANTKDHDLSSIIFKSDQPLILVAEAPEKPSNNEAIRLKIMCFFL